MAVYRRLGVNQPYMPAPRSEYSESLVGSIHFADLSEQDFSPLSVKTSGSQNCSLQNLEQSENSSPSGDSGFSDHSGSNTINKQHCTEMHDQLCAQLTGLTTFALQFVNDVHMDDNGLKARDLLDQLEAKVRAQLIRLDVQLSRAERQLRSTLDKSRIGETRINWLLQFNKCQIDMRQVFTHLCDCVFVELEHVLRVRDRGCCGLNVRQSTKDMLNQCSTTMQRCAQLIDMTRPMPE